jgi:very-short-patch-repair endonuclease
MQQHTLQSSREKLYKLSTRYELITFIPGLNKISRFFDKERGIEFGYYYGSLVHKLTKDPSFVPRLSKEDLSKRVSVGLLKLGYNPGQTPLAVAKRKATIQDKYGSEYYFRSNEYINRLPELRKKVRQTNLSKYGAENPHQNEDIKARVKQTKLDKGFIYSVDGKTLKEWASKTGRSKSSIKQLHAKGADLATIGAPSESYLETSIKSFLDSLNVAYFQNKKLEGSSYRPDFLLPDQALIIESDGLYWHSDASLEDKNYHLNKKKEYTNLGYRSLFFREDEILNKLDIVKSIIRNSLKLNSNKIFARKCVIKNLDSSFFVHYHLMGKGAGRSYGLFHKGVPVSGIQVKWANKDIKLLEISRFCSSPGTTVVGGLSKLLAYVIKVENPSYIQTFIDKRYGEGKYLTKLGFKESNTYLSFKWTDFVNVHNRMTFRGSTGYSNGLFRVWDCGQTKYVINL